MYKRKLNKLFCKRKRIKSSIVYKQEDINNILFNTSLLTVISDYIPLRKSGKDYVGRCPFCKSFTHNDYHFRVSPNKKLYKCFECGVGGKFATSFLMIYYNKPFDEILKYINKKYHNNKYKLNIEKIIINKQKNNIDEDLPF